MVGKVFADWFGIAVSGVSYADMVLFGMVGDVVLWTGMAGDIASEYVCHFRTCRRLTTKLRSSLTSPGIFSSCLDH